MSRFLSPLLLELLRDDDPPVWRVAAAFSYQSDAAARTITVPAGFVTDLASVPRIPVAYWLAGGTSNEAAVVHDYLYSTGIVSRETADAVLREASAVAGVPAWRRGLMWAGVRLFGGSHYTPAPPPSVVEFRAVTDKGVAVIARTENGRLVER